MVHGKLGFLGGSAGKESTCNAGDPSSVPGLGSSPTNLESWKGERLPAGVQTRLIQGIRRRDGIGDLFI